MNLLFTIKKQLQEVKIQVQIEHFFLQSRFRGNKDRKVAKTKKEQKK